MLIDMDTCYEKKYVQILRYLHYSFVLSFISCFNNDSNESLFAKRDGFVGVCESTSKEKEEEKTFLKKNILRPYDS